MMEDLIKKAAIVINDMEEVLSEQYLLFRSLAEKCKHYNENEGGSSSPCQHKGNTDGTMFTNCQPRTCPLLKED